MEKRVLRTKMRQTLRALDADSIRVKSDRVTQTLVQTTWWQEANIVLAFCSMKDEVATDAIIAAALRAGKQVGVPRMDGVKLIFHQLDRLDAAFVVHAYGIREPAPSWPIIEPADLPGGTILVLVPGLAFDDNRQRLGKGRGFYDRFLASLRTRPHLSISALGVCFTEQFVAAVPVDAHDQKLDGIICEDRIIP